MKRVQTTITFHVICNVLIYSRNATSCMYNVFCLFNGTSPSTDFFTYFAGNVVGYQGDKVPPLTIDCVGENC